MLWFHFKPFFGKIGGGRKKKKNKSFFTRQIVMSFVAGFLAATVFFGIADAGTFAIVTGSGDVLSASLLSSIFNSASGADSSTLKLSKNKKNAGSVIGSQDFFCPSDVKSCEQSYSIGYELELTIYPETGYKVKKITGCDISWNNDECVLSMDKSKEKVKVYFEKDNDYVSFKLSKNKRFGGSVTAEEYGFNCSSGESSCSQSFLKNSSVIFTATASSGYEFNKWKGCDYESDGMCTVEMKGKSESVKAYFKKTSFASSSSSSSSSGSSQKKLILFLNAKKIKNTERVGKVTTEGMADTCIAEGSKIQQCNRKYTKGSTMNLIAEPYSGYEIEKWSGCDSYSENNCSVGMTSNKVVRVYFKESEGEKNTLSIEASGGKAYGYIQAKTDNDTKRCWSDNAVLSGSSASTSDSSSPCEYKYSPGTEVELSYESYEASAVTVDGISNDDTGCKKGLGGNDCVITLNGDKKITANFSFGGQYVLTVEATGDKDDGRENISYGYVSVKSNNGTTKTCWSDNVSTNTNQTTSISPCEYYYDAGEKITLEYKLQGTVNNAGGVSIVGAEEGEITSARKLIIDSLDDSRTIKYNFTSGLLTTFIGYVKVNGEIKFDNDGASIDTANVSKSITSGDNVEIEWNAVNSSSCSFDKIKGEDRDANSGKIYDNKSGDSDKSSGYIISTITDERIDEASEYKIFCESSTGKDSVIAYVNIDIE